MRVSFAQPYVLLALLVVPAAAALAWWVNRRGSRYPMAFTNLDVLAEVAEEHRSWRRFAPIALLLIALALAAAAAAQPRATLTVTGEEATVVLLVDVSGSMRANDVEPTRLDAAVAAIKTFLSEVPSRYQVGLVDFSSSAEVLMPPTTDRAALNESLAYLLPEAGTAIGDGLDTAVKLLKASLAETATPEAGKKIPAAIVLLSDGAQNRGSILPLAGAREAKRAGIQVYTVALGTQHGVVTFGFGQYLNSIPVPPDPATMSQIARITGGKTFTAVNAEEVSSVYRSLGSQIGRHKERRAIGSWFAAGAAIALLGAGAAGIALGPRLP
ncbi:unannotated protein [freshwater metagenome]|uniref:Unannotated protein n=1 Tax=freshwater metagenome TaxID=449393 RepID=A0A6J6PIN6_9ZZZZ